MRVQVSTCQITSYVQMAMTYPLYRTMEEETEGETFVKHVM